LGHGGGWQTSWQFYKSNTIGEKGVIYTYIHTHTHTKKKRKIGLAVAVWLFFGCLHFVFAKTQQKAYKYVKNI